MDLYASCWNNFISMFLQWLGIFLEVHNDSKTLAKELKPALNNYTCTCYTAGFKPAILSVVAYHTGCLPPFTFADRKRIQGENQCCRTPQSDNPFRNVKYKTFAWVHQWVHCVQKGRTCGSLGVLDTPAVPLKYKKEKKWRNTPKLTLYLVDCIFCNRIIWMHNHLFCGFLSYVK